MYQKLIVITKHPAIVITKKLIPELAFSASHFLQASPEDNFKPSDQWRSIAINGPTIAKKPR
jgi:hypothetical protein